MTQWESVIGLEVHIQLATQSKLFSGASTVYGALPNTQACALDLGMPGVLPVLNIEAVRMAVKFGLSIDADIASHFAFARKNYFYPDLPKGYQITQDKLPIVGNAFFEIELEEGHYKKIQIARAHLEEDAGKSLHEGFEGMSGIDLNRSGMPLLEIVSQPDLRSPKEAVLYLKALHRLVCYLGICDGNLQEGSFRCDANVSVRPQGEAKLGTRTEIKNLNSFRFVERAINYEVVRQIEVLEHGGHLLQETRLYDADKNETRSMRDKEEATDYRYFPDPDLRPLDLTPEFLEEVRKTLPELPHQKRERFQQQYELSAYDADILVSTPELAAYFETVVKNNVPAKLAANWINGQLAASLNETGISITQSPISPERLAGLLQRVSDDTISGKIAKDIFEKLWRSDKTADVIIQEEGLQQVTDVSTIEKIIDKVIADNPKQLMDYRSGKDKLFAFFVGQAMKASAGKISPQQLNVLLKRKLDEA